MDDYSLATTFITSLGIGLMMGLERERVADAKAGLRTFALVALSGTALAMLAEKAGNAWLLPVALLVLGGMMVAAYARTRPEDDPGTTSTVALLLCFSFGALLWHGQLQLVVALALVTTSLLYFKAELHGVSDRLSREDRVSFLQFAVVTFIVLPVLPDRTFGPYDVFNPHRLWLFVVVIMGLNLAGYVVLRLAGPGRSLPWLGLIGGVVSSTATTLIYSRRAHADPKLAPAAAVVVLMASLMVVVRLLVITAILAPAVLPDLAPPLLAGLVLGAIAPMLAYTRLARGGNSPPPELRNPVELVPAIGFALAFAVLLFVMAWANDRMGTLGVYATSALAGLTDVDAITVSMLQLHGNGALPAATAAHAIVIAFGANLALKLVLVAVVAGRELARRIVVGFFAIGAGVAGATAAGLLM